MRNDGSTSRMQAIYLQKGNAGGHYMETVKVKDLMVPIDQYITVSAYASLYEAVDALEKARQNYEARGCPYRAVLVCDKGGRVIGKLGYIDVLRSLEPRYSEMGDLRKVSGHGLSAEFLKSMMDKYELWKSPLDDLCRKAADMKVGDLVASPLQNEVIDQAASLDRAVHQLIVGHFQSLLVTSQGEIVGLLRLSDVFDEIAGRMKACKI
jgi:CBS domain containing-hemolysin-like protein